MAAKKRRKWLSYMLIVALACLLGIPQLHEQPMPITVASDVNHSPQQALGSSFPEPMIEPQQAKDDQPTALSSNFHIFDNICSVDQIRADYKPMLNATIAQLDRRYRHYRVEVSQLIELNLYAFNISESFLAQLSEHLATIHADYIEKIGASARRAISLNVVITPNRFHYNHYVSLYHDSPETTLGVHLGHLNIAFVDYQGSDEKAYKTAIHEVVHAFNYHIIGKTPRMFNEGLAEFYEHTTIDAHGGLNPYLAPEHLTQELYPLMYFFENEQWPYLDKHRLYASSWAWMHFMRNSKDGNNALVHYIKNEMIKPCEAFSANESYAHFQEIYNMFESEFYEWQQDFISP